MSTNIIFMGTPEFSVPALREIHKNFKIKCVISQPPRKADRGQKI
tara:strand:+ start:116 stop:250 length:135 start_codon:yes stop_codon:yes gene_type:complete